MPKESRATIKIFDALGREVSTIINKALDAGTNEVNFNASNLTSGVYFYKIEATGLNSNKTFSETKKMILNK